MLIGLGYRKGSGKDYLGQYLVSEHGFQRMAFADAVRSVAASLFGFSPHQMEDRILKETVDPAWGFSPRQALQWIGTEAFRDGFGAAAVSAGVWGEDDRASIWTKVFERRYHQNVELQRMDGDEPRVVVTDVRFPNEALLIRRLGGVLGLVLRQGVTDQEAGGHLSEVAMAAWPWHAWDLILHNDGNAAKEQLDEYVRRCAGGER